MAATTIIAEMTKEIKYDRKSGDYACYLGGELIGYESTYSAAETFINNTYYEMLAHTSAPAEAPAPLPTEPAVTANTWQGEAGTTYADFSAGDGLTKALIGTHGGTKDGIELIIGGACINECSDEVLTLDDVRQLRDNLTALLNDPRLVSAVEGTPQPPTPAAPVAQAARGTLALDLTDINRAIGYTAARLSQTLDCLTPARRDALMRLIAKLDTASAPERDDLVDTLLRSASAWHYAPLLRAA